MSYLLARDSGNYLRFLFREESCLNVFLELMAKLENLFMKAAADLGMASLPSGRGCVAVSIFIGIGWLGATFLQVISSYSSSAFFRSDWSAASWVFRMSWPLARVRSNFFSFL